LTAPVVQPNIASLSIALPTCPSMQPPIEATHKVTGSPPDGPDADDSMVPDSVVLNHSSTVSGPAPAKYPPGMLTCELPLKAAEVPSANPVGPAPPRATLE
jgi:hypothetical protein